MPDGPRVLITGASSGIGAALALRYAVRQARLVLAARRLPELEAVAALCVAAGAEVRVVACDVCREGDCARAVAEAVTAWQGLDIAIANAGFGVSGAFATLTAADYRRQFETNVHGVLATAAAALPELLKSRGRLAIVGSIAAHLPGPLSSAYAMSKAAVRSFAESLGIELAGTGVSVTLLSPGFVESQIRRVDNLGRLDSAQADPAPRILVARADRVAAVMERAIRRRRHERVITGHGHVLVLLARFAPGLVRMLMRQGMAVGRRRHAASLRTPLDGRH